MRKAQSEGNAERHAAEVKKPRREYHCEAIAPQQRCLHLGAGIAALMPEQYTLS